MSQAALDIRGMRKFGCRAEAAEFRVKGALERGTRGLQGCVVQCLLCSGGLRRQCAECSAKLWRVHCNLVLLLSVVISNALQKILKGRHAVTWLTGEISAAEERVLAGRQEHGQRPAPGAVRQNLLCDLIDFVQVRPFLTIDLDVDEQFVHDGSSAGILKRLMCHHVTPVACRVADGQQNGLVVAGSGVERGGAPRVPVHRVVSML